MNTTAFIQGYICKSAAGPAAPTPPKPPEGDVPEVDLGKYIDKWNAAKQSWADKAMDVASRGIDKVKEMAPVVRQGPDPNWVSPHQGYFDRTMTKWALKNNKDYGWLLDPYKPEPMDELTKRLPQSVYDTMQAGVEQKIREEAARGDYTTAKKYYSISPKAREIIQKEAIPKIKAEMNKKIGGYVTKYGPWLLGGGALVFLLATLFRRKNQGASQSEIAKLQAQINQLQAQQKPMRLNMVGNR